MKKLFKIATASALVMLSANAVASEATGYFQWTGSIVPTNIESDIKIIDTGTIKHDKGELQFTESSTAGEYEISSSTELAFDVVNASTDVHVDYTYTVETIQFSLGSDHLGTDFNGQFEVIADGVSVVKNTISGDITGETVLTLGSTAGFVAEGGDTLIVLATVLVSGEI